MKTEDPEYFRRWRAANPEKVKAAGRKHEQVRKSDPAKKLKRDVQKAEWREARRAHLRVKAKQWRAANPDKQKALAWAGALRRYGLTPETYRALWESQGCQCALCREPLPLRGKRTHVDHCHATGRVRGILCSTCNVRLGYIETRGEAGLLEDFAYLGSR